MNPLGDLIRRHASSEKPGTEPAPADGPHPLPVPATGTDCGRDRQAEPAESLPNDLLSIGGQLLPEPDPPDVPERGWERRPATVAAWKTRFPRLLARAPEAIGPPGARKNPAVVLEIEQTAAIFFRLAGSVFRDYENLTPRPVELGLTMLDRMEAHADRLPVGPTDRWAEWVIEHAPAYMDPAEDDWFDLWRQMSLFEAATELRRFRAELRDAGTTIYAAHPSVGKWVNASSDPRAAISRRFTLGITLAAHPLPPTKPYTLAPLTGSPKQVAWANTIRAEKWPRIEAYATPKAFDPAIPNAARVPYGSALRRLAMASEAKAWIDGRSRSAPRLVEEAAGLVRIGKYPYSLDAETVSAKGGVGRLVDAARRA